MKKFLIEFDETGVCKVDVGKVVKAWTDKFMLDVYGEKWRLVKYGRGQNYAKVQISEEQAQEIIQKAKLRRINSTTFSLAATYKKPEFIKKELDRLAPLLEEAKMRVYVLEKNRNALEHALLTPSPLGMDANH